MLPNGGGQDFQLGYSQTAGRSHSRFPPTMSSSTTPRPYLMDASFNSAVTFPGLTQASINGGISPGSLASSTISSRSLGHAPPFAPALDYSYKNISSLEDANVSLDASSSHSLTQRTIRPRQSLRKSRRSPSGRFNSNVIRLANNNLVDTKGLYKMALDVVEYPEDIAWLDLSFNDISSVSDDILEFPALKMIYLHGNKIARFADVAKLQRLPNLYSLTLHGNPIENYPNYRYCDIPHTNNTKLLQVECVSDPP